MSRQIRVVKFAQSKFIKQWEAMDIVLGILVAFVLCGSIWPRIVRNRQFFLIGAAIVAVAMIIPWIFFARILEAGAFVLFVLAANGGTLDDWRKQFIS